METATIGVIFIAVWLGLVFLYCIFRACGGRIVDILSCDFCAGPCCDCWGAGGTIDKYDKEYPFRDHNQELYYDPYGPYSRPQPQLPPIVVVNSMKDKARRREEADGYTSSDDEDYRSGVRSERAKRTAPRDPELREEAGGALLLRSSEMNTAPGRRNEPVVV
jgi:hypothetical protein